MTMTTYEALLAEISVVQTARDRLPNDTHVGALFDFTIGRLWEQADANIHSAKVFGGIARPFVAISDSSRLKLPRAS
jgi:hypothetical protein